MFVVDSPWSGAPHRTQSQFVTPTFLNRDPFWGRDPDLGTDVLVNVVIYGYMKQDNFGFLLRIGMTESQGSTILLMIYDCVIPYNCTSISLSIFLNRPNEPCTTSFNQFSTSFSQFCFFPLLGRQNLQNPPSCS